MSDGFDWRRFAACREVGTEGFFSDSAGTGGGLTREIQIAKAMCVECPVRRECLSEALRVERFDHSNRYGIWGGLTGRERRHLWSQLLTRMVTSWCTQQRHVMTEENTYRAPSGGVYCRACRAETKRAARERAKAG